MKDRGVSRRQFLKNSTLGLLGTGAAVRLAAGTLEADKAEQQTAGPAKVKTFRKLGRTGFMTTDLGSGQPTGTAVLNALLDAGVNYIDTGESYFKGKSEIWAGQALKNRDRKSYFITSKLQIKEGESKESLVQRTRKCLERLDTPYLDCMMIHSAPSVESLQHPGFHAAMKQLKTEGKVHFLGVSNHGPGHWGYEAEPMDKVLIAAAQDGRFDVLLLAYNFIQRDMGERVIEVCMKKNIGVTLMKTNPVGKYMSIKAEVEAFEKQHKEAPEDLLVYMKQLKKSAEEGETFIKEHHLENSSEIRAAATRFVLAHPGVSNVLCRCDTFEDVEQFVPLSGTTLTRAEQEKLSAFIEGPGRLYCRHACGICEIGCPHGVPVNSIMRYNHYFEAQRLEKYAMQKYADLQNRAEPCTSCSGGCQERCPYDVPIRGLLTLAHQRLSP